MTNDHSLPENTEGMPPSCAGHTHEHVGWRKWGPLVGYLILVIGLVVALWMGYDVVKQNRQLIKQNEALISRVASDCFDRDGDLSYRHVLRGLIRMNHNEDPFTGKPIPPTMPAEQRRALTAELLAHGLVEAGPTPKCIEARP